MRSLLYALMLASISFATPAAADEPAGFWTTPTIQGFGKIHYLKDAAYQPEPDQVYKIVFSVTESAASPGAVNAGLDHVARTVNLYTAAGVPLDHLKFVAIISGAATPLAMDAKQFENVYGVVNPNLPLISALRHAGVDVAVCGQAVAEHNIQYDQLDGAVTLALSGLTTVTTLEHQGYAFLQP